MDIFSDSTEFTENVGRAIGAWAKPKTVIRLNGGLGMGKTVIAKGIARGLGIEEPITSPSYSIIQEYPGQPGLIHIDLYRINDEDEIDELGLDEMLAVSPSVVIIEWAERADASRFAGLNCLDLQLLPGEKPEQRIIRLPDDISIPGLEGEK